MLRPGSCRVFRFADFEADVQAGELRRNGVKVPLQEQPFQVLVALLERSGELVWRENLRQQVWPQDTYVEFDHALNTAVKKIRIALGDCANSPSFVETIPKRGYRFVVPVSACEEPCVSADPLTGRATTPLPRRWFSTPVARGLLAVTVLASVALLGMRWKSGVSSANAEPVTLAVLPLEDWSDGSAHAALSDGITEELNMQLSRMDPARLKVCPRAATQPYRRTSKTVADVAGELHANYLLAGELRGDARRVRVTLELIRVRDRARVWGDEFDRDVEDPLALETELAAAVTAKLKAGAFTDGTSRH